MKMKPKRLKKRPGVKNLGRRGLSLLMAMVMSLSLVQISAFATDGEAADTLKPESCTDSYGHNITLSKTAERVGDTEWQVTVNAKIGETAIKQQPLEVVFVLDRSGSMMFCTDPDHDKGSHVHENDDVLYDGIYYKRTGYTHSYGHPDNEWEWVDGKYGDYKKPQLNYSACPDYTPCTQKEARHEVSGGRHDATDWLPCQYKDENGNWVNYETRLSVAQNALTSLEKQLPKGTDVKYVSFSNEAQVEDSLSDVVAQGGTNIMAGVDMGIDLLNQSQSAVAKKVLVLLTDGESNNYNSQKLTNFNGDVYTVGFTVDNQKLAGMIKGNGQYICANDADALNAAFSKLATRISAMIVDPMGSDVTYVSNSAKNTGKVDGTVSVDGSTLRWIPTNQDKFSDSTIEYTYNVKLTPNAEAGDYTGIKLNNTTTLQYGVEENGKTTKCEAAFPIPEGYYKVSTLTEEFVDADGNVISDSVQKRHDVQSKVTDNGSTTLEVYAPTQALDTNDEHVKYVYQYSTLDGKEINAKDDEGNITLSYVEPYDKNTLDVTDKAEAHKLVHHYVCENVNSVEYKYEGEVPDDATKLTGDYAKTWYPTGTDGIEVQPDAESEQYNFSGWKTENVEVDEDGKFTLSTDVTFVGSWEIKPSYKIQANYYTVTDNDTINAQKDNTYAILLDGPIYTNEDEEIYSVAGEDMTYGGNTYTEVQLGEGNPAGVTVEDNTVRGITPTQSGAVITVNIYRYVENPAFYTVTHKYINVDPDGKETEVTEDKYTSGPIEGVHGQTVSADSVVPDTKDGKYEVVDRSEDITLDKSETKNITLTYEHYQYAVTITGDDGVNKGALTGAGTYDKDDNVQVGFTLNEGYQVESVTDNDVNVTDQAKDGIYDISKIGKNHTVVVTTEKIKCTLSVQYIFYDGQKPTTGFDNYTVSLDYGTQYDSYVDAKTAPAGYDRTVNGTTTGVITGNTTVYFLYVPKGNATVNVYYQREDDHMPLRAPKSQSGRIDTSFDVTSWKIDSITDGGKIYDLVDGTEHGKDAAMTGTYQTGGTNICLYYKERTKANITIKYQSENEEKATLSCAAYSVQGYLNTEYDISGTTYIPETIIEEMRDGTFRTWYYSGNDQLVITGAEKLTGTLTNDITVVAKYYLKPTYSVTATYTTVSNGSSSEQTDVTDKQSGEVGQKVPFDLSSYVVKYGFTSGNYQNDLSVNGVLASEMPEMEKFADYAVTLSYKKTVNSGVSTTIRHEFQTFLDGVEITDDTTAPDNVFSHTWGENVDMSKYSKAGQTGFEGYTVAAYSAPDGQLRAGDKGTITYVRNLVSVVFDLNGGTWNDSLNDVKYSVAKNSGLNDQQPVPQPTKSGYKFAGWTAEPSNAVPTGSFDQATKFTAKWERESVVITSHFYTVTYNYTVTTDGTVTYQDSETTGVQDTTSASKTITAPATARHDGYTFSLASAAEQTADLTGTTREAPHQFVVNYTLTLNNGGGNSGRDDDDDNPAPVPDPDDDDDDVIIPDDDTSKTDVPADDPADIPDDDTPKTDVPADHTADVPSEDTPKADVPKTGDSMGLWVMAAVGSGAGLVWLNLTGKKRKDDNG